MIISLLLVLSWGVPQEAGAARLKAAVEALEAKLDEGWAAHRKGERPSMRDLLDGVRSEDAATFMKSARSLMSVYCGDGEVREELKVLFGAMLGPAADRAREGDAYVVDSLFGFAPDPAIVAAALDSSPRVRRAGLRFLVKCGRTLEGLGALRKLLGDADPETRVRAAECVARSREILKGDDLTAWMRSFEVDWLKGAESKAKMSERLLTLAGRADLVGWARDFAAVQLGPLGDAAALEGLLVLAIEGRMTALRSAWMLDPVKTLPAIGELLGSVNPTRSGEAARFLTEVARLPWKHPGPAPMPPGGFCGNSSPEEIQAAKDEYQRRAQAYAEDLGRFRDAVRTWWDRNKDTPPAEWD